MSKIRTNSKRQLQPNSPRKLPLLMLPLPRRPKLTKLLLLTTPLPLRLHLPKKPRMRLLLLRRPQPKKQKLKSRLLHKRRSNRHRNLNPKRPPRNQLPPKRAMRSQRRRLLLPLAQASVRLKKKPLGGLS